jgi:RNA polymerase sigma-70 factor (ECF subfamily)
MKETDLTVERCKKGSRAAFESLFEKHKIRVFNTVYRMVHNFNDAQDILQNVFIKVFNNVRDFNSQSQFSTWLYKIAINESLNFIKANKKHRDTLGSERQLENVSPQATPGVFPLEERLENREMVEIIRRILEKMEEQRKSVFALFYFSELNLSEICQALGLPMGTVKSKLSRAKSEIKEELCRLKIL